MSRNTLKKVAFSPDADDDKPTTTTTTPGIYRKQQGYVVGTKVGGNKKRVAAIWGFRISKSSASFAPVRLLTRIGAKVAKALHFMSSRKRSSRKVSSSASLARSRSYAETLDSQRAEAIEDCIEFLNSSSSLQRSNSVASSC